VLNYKPSRALIMIDGVTFRTLYFSNHPGVCGSCQRRYCRTSLIETFYPMGGQ
jgi:hypothetical protein